jgi:hypothetical protein
MQFDASQVGHCTFGSLHPLLPPTGPAETQSHVQCLCPALKEARIWTHHNLVQKLWTGIWDASKGWIITVDQIVAGLRELP